MGEVDHNPPPEWRDLATTTVIVACDNEAHANCAIVVDGVLLAEKGQVEGIVRDASRMAMGGMLNPTPTLRAAQMQTARMFLSMRGLTFTNFDLVFDASNG